MQGFGRIVAAVVVAGSVALSAACTPGTGGGPTPSAQPTATPTPSENQFDRQRRLDFEAAEKAFRTFEAERSRLLEAGGAKAATATLKSSGAGPFLEETADLLTAYRDTDSRQEGADQIAYVNRGGYSETSLLIDSCLDRSAVKTYTGKKLIGGGEFRRIYLTARKLEGTWKIWSATSEKVASCAT